MNIRMAAATDRGILRDDNQDSFFVDESRGLAIVADGVGGNQAGALASQLTVSSIAQRLKFAVNTPDRDALTLLRESVLETNQLVLEESQKTHSLRGMATTLDALWIKGSRAYWAHVGDSRIYRRSGDGPWLPITQDHNIKSLLASGEPTREGFFGSSPWHSDLKALTNVVGVPECDPDLNVLDLTADTELFLLCTDGLYNMVSESDMFSIISDNHSQNLHKIVQQLIDEANEQGGADNITAVLVKWNRT